MQKDPPVRWEECVTGFLKLVDYFCLPSTFFPLFFKNSFFIIPSYVTHATLGGGGGGGGSLCSSVLRFRLVLTFLAQALSHTSLRPLLHSLSHPARSFTSAPWLRSSPPPPRDGTRC